MYHFHCHQYESPDVQDASLSIASSKDVHGVSISAIPAKASNMDV